MTIKRITCLIIVLAWHFGSAAYGQPSGIEPIYPPPSPLTPQEGTAHVPATKQVPASGGLSDWITYKRDGVDGPQGAYTPLYTEAYLNVGPSFPVGGQTLSRELKAGWSITGGARALFFNEQQTRAWAVDLHIIHTNESGGKQNTEFAVTTFRNVNGTTTKVEFGQNGLPGATIQFSNRTLGGVGIGREVYVRQAANADGWKWRCGFDLGGRWGSTRLVLREDAHLSDVIASFYVAGHSDLEFPLGLAVVHAGLRWEWAYSWSDVLQRSSDVQDISLLMSIGLRW